MKTYLHARALPVSAKRTTCGLSTVAVQYVCTSTEDPRQFTTPPAPPCPECVKRLPRVRA